MTMVPPDWRGGYFGGPKRGWTRWVAPGLAVVLVLGIVLVIVALVV
jgi:hypothetical protein